MDFWVRGQALERNEQMGCYDMRYMMMPAQPGEAFKMIQAQAVFQLLVVVFDPSTYLALAHQLSNRRAGRQRGESVIRRRIGIGGPLNQQPTQHPGSEPSEFVGRLRLAGRNRRAVNRLFINPWSLVATTRAETPREAVGRRKL